MILALFPATSTTSPNAVAKSGDASTTRSHRSSLVERARVHTTRPATARTTGTASGRTANSLRLAMRASPGPGSTRSSPAMRCSTADETSSQVSLGPSTSAPPTHFIAQKPTKPTNQATPDSRAQPAASI